MSIKERMVGINEEEYERERNKQRAEEEAVRLKSQKYSKEYPEANRQQAILLEELRGFGVVKLLEELINEPIFPIRDDSGKYISREPTPEEWRRLSQSAMQNPRVGLYPVYDQAILRPPMGEDGSAIPELGIKILHTRWVGIPNISGGDGYGHDSILLNYKRDRILTVSGEQIVFSGQVPENEKERIEIVSEAIAKALVHPQRERKGFF